MAHPLLVGAVLTFATTDATELALTVTLKEERQMVLQWGDVPHAVNATRHHTFRGLPTPKTATVAYSLKVEGEEILAAVVKSPFAAEQHFALYGDSRDGVGPHQQLVAAIDRADPHVLIHTGDVVHQAGIESEWIQHLATAMPLSSRVPLILALGNHELWVRRGHTFNALEDALQKLPPPDDALARKMKAGAGTYHVRIGPTLVVALDSNRPLGEGSAQLDYLKAVLQKHKDAKHKFAAMHHGPRSSGRHGRHKSAPGLTAVLQKHGVTASLAGHDHLYERIVEGDVTYFVSGGGGAPLYQRRRPEPGSRAFMSTYNWVMMFLGATGARFEAYALEGAMLDRDTMPAAQKKALAPEPRGRLPWAVAVLGAGVLLVGWSILRRRY